MVGGDQTGEKSQETLGYTSDNIIWLNIIGWSLRRQLYQSFEMKIKCQKVEEEMHENEVIEVDCRLLSQVSWNL